MEKFLSTLLVLTILFSVVSCDSGEHSNEVTAPEDSNEEIISCFEDPCPVKINVRYYTSDQTLSIRQDNQSSKTIVAIKYLIIVYDVYGEVLRRYGNGAYFVSATYDDFNIRAGNSSTGDWRLSGYSKGKTLNIYVYSVYFSDQTEWGNRDSNVEDIKKYAPKTLVIGDYA